MIKNKKVLLQLSGGKDSIACLLYLKKNNVNVVAIHFVHQYGYEIPTEMARTVCTELSIKLFIIDITEQIEKLFLDNFRDRPCRYCKAIMDKMTVDFAQKESIDFICVGDTADDTMLVNRIKEHDGVVSPFSKYFNAQVHLPPNIIIYRPLISKTSSYTMSLVTSTFPFFRRINDTGDKYFEYSREGCPLQFKDLGVKYTKELMLQLKNMNKLCSEFATRNGIKASIHLPSEFLVTIPVGYEEKCRTYLLEKGCHLKESAKSLNINVTNITMYISSQSNIKDVFLLAMPRFAERINISKEKLKKNGAIYEINLGNFSLKATCSNLNHLAIININILDFNSVTIPFERIRNICIEIFHTDKILITNSILA